MAPGVRWWAEGALARASSSRTRGLESRAPHYAGVLRRGSLEVKLSLGRFAPRPNQQSTHSQDEIYVVVRARGILRHGDRREAFEGGDLLLVGAGIDHCFEEFSDDLVVWVIFFGPGEGEPVTLDG